MTVTHQHLCPWDSPGQEYQSGSLCLPPGDLPDPGITAHISCVSCIAGRFFTHWTTLAIQSLSQVQLFATPWTAALQASPAFTISPSLLKSVSIELGHPTISSSVVPFSSYPQSFPALASFPMSRFSASGAKASAPASVLPINIQGWVPLRSPILSRLTYNFSFRGMSSISSCQQAFICRMIANESILVCR